MDRTVKVGDVYRGKMSGRTPTVIEMTPGVSAILEFNGLRYSEPMTTYGTLKNGDLYTLVKKAAPETTPDLLPGDRVRLAYNKRGGTVVGKTDDDATAGDQYLIRWDHRTDLLTERREDLVVLHAPRDTDAPFPAQKIIDEVEALRQKLIAEVEARQAQISKINGIINKLKGVEF